MSAGASFSFAGASVAASYKDFDNDVETFAVGVGYGIAGWSVGVQWEAFVGDVNDDDSLVRFNAGYDLGNGMNFSGRVNVFTDDDESSSGDFTDYRVLLTKAF